MRTRVSMLATMLCVACVTQSPPPPLPQPVDIGPPTPIFVLIRRMCDRRTFECDPALVMPNTRFDPICRNAQTWQRVPLKRCEQGAHVTVVVWPSDVTRIGPRESAQLSGISGLH